MPSAHMNLYIPCVDCPSKLLDLLYISYFFTITGPGPNSCALPFLHPDHLVQPLLPQCHLRRSLVLGQKSQLCLTHLFLWFLLSSIQLLFPPPALIVPRPAPPQLQPSSPPHSNLPFASLLPFLSPGSVLR